MQGLTMWTIEPVIDPDQPDQILCYLVVDEYDMPRGHYDTIDDAGDAIRALQGDSPEAGRYSHPGTTYYPD